MTPTPSEMSDIGSYIPIVNQKKQLISKWNLIFAKSSGSAWISFKPDLGLHVYPCYACKDMFASKVTFQDHINRRAIRINYKCSDCNQNLTFYNRCSFLLHARTHFSLEEGKIDMIQLDIFSLPFGMMGFLPYPGITKLFDVEEELIGNNAFLNTQFYSPDMSNKGNRFVTLKPNDLLFCSIGKDSQITQLTLRQICVNVPLCEFITLEDHKNQKKKFLELESAPVVKVERPDSDETSENDNHFQIPVISKIESLNTDHTTYPKCPECDEIQRCPMKVHFSGKNVPFDDNLKCPACQYIASTPCSFSAHQRIHSNAAPFICPECGKKFESKNYLLTHLDDVCFHSVKQVRFRCPGKKCGKLFVTSAVFSTHFSQHISPWFQCSDCNEGFGNPLLFSEHAKTHSTLCHSERVYKCFGCKTDDNLIYSGDDVQNHIQEHIADRSRCMYVYVCKYCRNSFRSTVTYAAHSLKCQKVERPPKRGFSFILDNCIQCASRLIFYENETSVICTKCQYINVLVINKAIKRRKLQQQGKPANSVSICVLCRKEIPTDQLKYHPTECFYRNPQIVVKKLDKDISESGLTITNISELSNESNATEDDSNQEQTPQKSSESNETDSSKSISPKNQDYLKRKKRSQKAKKPLMAFLDEPSELLVDEVKEFDGTYYCKMCKFQDSDRKLFHEHIVTHRDVSTSYQCMECGECFVVKPSLTKHLVHYHKIKDIDDYLEHNNCYDKEAVEELKENMKLTPGEHKGHVKDNQCRVCLEEFTDALELNKHFRIHGMAFLMKNNRE